MKERSSSSGGRGSDFFESLCSFLRRCFFGILSMGPIPNHIAIIMDGNRRYAKKENLEVGSGHRAGYLSLMSILQYCYELRVKYVTIYAFSIENFKRHPDEVQNLMSLMLEKIEGLLEAESIVNEYGIRVYFIGDLKLLNESVRLAAEKVMRATAANTKCALLICVAYTSCNEIVHAVQESCTDKHNEIQPCNSHTTHNGKIEEVEHGKDMQSIQEANEGGHVSKPTRNLNGEIPGEEGEKTSSIVKVLDVEKHMYMSVAPDPDIVIRSSGETRLSNFLLWQTALSALYSPNALWPEIGLRHLVWAILNYQRNYSYLEKRRKQF